MLLHYRLVALTLAAAPNPDASANIFGYILQYGLIGLLLLDVTWWHKLFVPRWIMDRLEAEWARERAEKDAVIAGKDAIIAKFTELTEQQIIPALTRNADRDREYLQFLQERHRDGR